MSLLINSTETVFLIVQVLAVSFLAILFLQSGLDKVVDKKGNLDWLSSHFANSPFKNFVPVLFFTITVVELLSGILNLLGVVFLLFEGSLILALYGTILASVALIMLFLGQRIAKDYVGAQSLV
ncbi:MAG: DoxX family protein, partial [Flavobacteriales bacterium]